MGSVGDDSTTFLPDDPDEALHGSVIVGAGLPEHALVDAASAEAAKLVGENEVIASVELGESEPYGQGGAQVQQYFSYWVRSGP